MLSKQKIWAEMARRKVQFHNDESWNEIKLWGLFNWRDISRLLKSGELFAPGYTKENKIVWCYPSKESWETNIFPLIERYSLDELTRMAGW